VTLLFNGVECEAVEFNGVDLDDAYINGEHVFHRPGPFIMANPAESEVQVSGTGEILTLGIRGLDHTDSLTRLINIKTYSDASGGGWSPNSILMAEDGNSVSGSSLVSVYGLWYGFGTDAGQLIAYSGSVASASRMSVVDGKWAGSMFAVDGDGNVTISAEERDAGGLRVSIAIGGSAHCETKQFIPS